MIHVKHKRLIDFREKYDLSVEVYSKENIMKIVKEALCAVSENSPSDNRRF